MTENVEKKQNVSKLPLKNDQFVLNEEDKASISIKNLKAQYTGIWDPERTEK